MFEKLSAKFEALLVEAQSRGASDLHLIPGEPPTLRVDGVLERSNGEALDPEEVLEMASEIVPKSDIDRIGQEIAQLDRSITVGEIAARVCVSRAYGAITLAIRLLPTSVLDVKRLGVPQGLIDAVKSPSGLIVLSGRTGSGKSTTAYSLLDYINEHHNANIFTIEDPIMYRLTPKKSILQQREVGVDIPSDVAGLKLMMRVDPDVAFISEIRTLEVLQACITAAEVGHLVMIVLHQDSPETALKMIVDVFAEDMRGAIRRQLSTILRCVSCQRLLPRAGGQGRVAAYGVLVPDDEMKNAITEGRDVLSRKTSLPDTCLSMKEEIERMASQGIITDETAKAYIETL